MKIEVNMTTLHCFEKLRFCMEYIAKTNLSKYLLHVTVHNLSYTADVKVFFFLTKCLNNLIIVDMLVK